MAIRLLKPDDVTAATEMSTAAGWNQTEQDWITLLTLNPETCFGLEYEGHLVSTATLNCYGQRLGWVGMVLTQPEFRKRGFAGQLLQRVVAEADARGIRTLKLDATEQGEPIYEALGFVGEQRVERWVGAGTDDGSWATVGAVLRDLDARAFGADRETLLLQLARATPTLTMADGYVMRRTGRRASYLGPCVARSPAAAEHLIRAALRQDPGPWFWDLLPENVPAVRLAKRLGFAVDRKLVRMYRGEPLRAKEAWVYALAGFEFG